MEFDGTTGHGEKQGETIEFNSTAQPGVRRNKAETTQTSQTRR
jgi:hypothetical protein